MGSKRFDLITKVQHNIDLRGNYSAPNRISLNFLFSHLEEGDEQMIVQGTQRDRGIERLWGMYVLCVCPRLRVHLSGKH